MADKQTKTPIADKNVKIEASLGEWITICQALDQCAQTLMMIRRQAKAQPEMAKATEVAEMIPDMIMTMQDSMHLIKHQLAENISLDDLATAMAEAKG